LTKSSLQQSSIPTYTRAWKLFAQFHIAIFQTARFSMPISPVTLALFIAYLFDHNYVFSTVNTYVSAIGYSHKLSSLPAPTRVFYIIQMLKVYARNGICLDSCLLVTLPILQSLLAAAPAWYYCFVLPDLSIQSNVLFGILRLFKDWQNY
jgi:hypothetical protein